MGPLKIISDGSLNTRTAWCCEQYVDGSGGPAAPNQSSAELRRSASTWPTATGSRWPPTRSATSPCARRSRRTTSPARSGRSSTPSWSAARPCAGWPARAPRERAAGAPARRPRRDRADLAGPRGAMLRVPVDARRRRRVAFGSDAPVSPLDPWLAIAAAVHRSADERPPWHPEQALTAREALAASVDGRGSVHAGMPADLVLLDADPLAEHPDTASAGSRAAHDAGRPHPGRWGDRSLRLVSHARASVRSRIVSGSSSRSPYSSRSWPMR